MVLKQVLQRYNRECILDSFSLYKISCIDAPISKVDDAVY